MIPYADLAAALERKNAGQAAAEPPAATEDTTLAGAELEAPQEQEYEIGDEIAEEEPA